MDYKTITLFDILPLYGYFFNKNKLLCLLNFLVFYILKLNIH